MNAEVDENEGSDDPTVTNVRAGFKPMPRPAAPVSQPAPKSTAEIVRENRCSFEVAGSAIMVVGLCTALAPSMLELDIVAFTGVMIALAAIAQAIHAARTGHIRGAAAGGIIAVLYGVVGILLVDQPGGDVIVIPMLLAGYFIIEAVVRMVSFQQRSGLYLAGWTALSAVVSLVMAVVIFGEWPLRDSGPVGVTAGLDLLAAGWALAALGKGTVSTPA